MEKKSAEPRMTVVHYIIGGLVGVFIVRLLQGELTLIGSIIGFIAWPIVFVFGLFVAFTRLIGVIL